nr:protein PELOTA 1 [Tanacetum cinerariifolium]
MWITWDGGTRPQVQFDGAIWKKNPLTSYATTAPDTLKPKRPNAGRNETLKGWPKRAKAGRNARRLAETSACMLAEKRPGMLAETHGDMLAETCESWPELANAGRNARTLAETRERWPKRANVGLSQVFAVFRAFKPAFARLRSFHALRPAFARFGLLSAFARFGPLSRISVRFRALFARFHTFLSAFARFGPTYMCHVEVANERVAVETLLITDELFRSADIATRQRYVNLVNAVKKSGGTAHVFYSGHVSGEQLAQYTGVAAILRIPLPDLDDIEM